jgi:hypothetical protein
VGKRHKIVLEAVDCTFLELRDMNQEDRYQLRVDQKTGDPGYSKFFYL